MERRKRRSFTEEFKAETVRLVREGAKSLPQLAKDLDLTESALRLWVQKADEVEGKETPGTLSQAEREEPVSLRRENRQLVMERDFLKTLLHVGHLLRQKLPVPYRGAPGGSGRPLFGDVRAR